MIIALILFLATFTVLIFAIMKTCDDPADDEEQWKWCQEQARKEAEEKGKKTNREHHTR